MWYMKELNQFLVQMLLPSDAIRPDASKSDTLTAITDALTQQETSEDGAQTMQRQLQHGLPATASARRQLTKADLLIEGKRQRALQQDATGITIADQEDLPDPEAVLPLADEIGELYMYTADDLRAIAPLWWDYTKKMRVFHETHAEVY